MYFQTRAIDLLVAPMITMQGNHTRSLGGGGGGVIHEIVTSLVIIEAAKTTQPPNALVCLAAPASVAPTCWPLDKESKTLGFFYDSSDT